MTCPHCHEQIEDEVQLTDLDAVFAIIVAQVCQHFNTTMQALLSPSLNRSITLARHSAMWLMRYKVPSLLDRQIAPYFQRERSAVSHGMMVFRNAYETNEKFRNKIETIKTKLNDPE